MADVVDGIAECAHSFPPNINIKSVVTCINCAQMKRQLDDVLLQLKSLQKINELLQQVNEAPKMVNLGGTADNSAVVNYKEVKSAYPNNYSNIISKLRESDSNNVTNDCEVLNLLNDARHQVISSIENDFVS
jgi:hypothetical protein